MWSGISFHSPKIMIAGQGGWAHSSNFLQTRSPKRDISCRDNFFVIPPVSTLVLFSSRVFHPTDGFWLSCDVFFGLCLVEVTSFSAPPNLSWMGYLASSPTSRQLIFANHKICSVFAVSTKLWLQFKGAGRKPSSHYGFHDFGVKDGRGSTSKGNRIFHVFSLSRTWSNAIFQ